MNVERVRLVQRIEQLAFRGPKSRFGAPEFVLLATGLSEQARVHQLGREVPRVVGVDVQVCAESGDGNGPFASSHQQGGIVERGELLGEIAKPTAASVNITAPITASQ